MTDALFDPGPPVVDDDPHYFSNSTEHDMWSAYWCEGCVKDHSTHRNPADYDDACPCLAVAFLGEPVEGWVLDNRYVGNPVMRVRCSYYEPCKCKRGAWNR